MPIFGVEPTDLKKNTHPEPVQVTVPVGSGKKKVPDPNKDADRQFKQQEELKTSLMFSSDRDLKHITSEIRGMKWEVDYFLQVRDINDATAEPDIALNKNTQKYNRINNLILFVQTAITQDAPSNLTGEAYINAGVVPNVHDVFKAQLTGGREALFIVTEVVNNTYNLHRCFIINYKLHSFIDKAPRLYDNIKAKVVKTYIYNKDYIKDYSAPILMEQDYQNIQDLNTMRSVMITHYFNMFTNKNDNYTSLHLPTVNKDLAIDPYLEKFVFSVFSISDSPALRTIRRIHVPEEDGIDYTVFDAILSRNFANWPLINSDIGWNYIDFYNNSYITTRNLVYLGVKYTIQKNGNLDIGVITNPIDNRPDDYEPPVTTTGKRTYVFSEYFYRREPEHCGILERAVLRFISGKTVDEESLTTLLKQYHQWDVVDQFYGIPILIVLMKDYINNAYRNV